MPGARTFTMLLMVSAAAPAWAAFEIVPDTGVGTAPSTSEPPIQAAPSKPRLRRPTVSAGPPVAQGFGAQVPLAFAARQIVPPGIRVTFGPGVDQAAPVDWRGGRRWDDVLRAALAPLSLRATPGGRTVSITR